MRDQGALRKLQKRKVLARDHGGHRGAIALCPVGGHDNNFDTVVEARLFHDMGVGNDLVAVNNHAGTNADNGLLPFCGAKNDDAHDTAGGSANITCVRINRRCNDRAENTCQGEREFFNA